MNNTNLSVSQINNITNNRIYDRNIPSSQLQPLFSLRPTPTKYTKMMDVIPPVSNNVPLTKIPLYSTSKTFLPTSRNAPFPGFTQNVDLESDLRNQFYSLQNAQQSVYVPHSESSLYTLESYAHEEKPNVQTHPLLFQEQKFDSFDPNVGSSSQDQFNNHTRQNIKNIK